MSEIQPFIKKDVSFSTKLNQMLDKNREKNYKTITINKTLELQQHQLHQK